MRVCLVVCLIAVVLMSLPGSIELPPVDHRQSAIFEPGEVNLGEWHTLTAYCACALCCGKWADGRTASGTWATEGRTIAADPRLWGMGACVHIPGLDRAARYIVEDTGSAILGEHIDVYIGSHSRALEFGVKLRRVVDCDLTNG